MKTKRILAWVLSLAMMITLLPTAAAEEPTVPATPTVEDTGSGGGSVEWRIFANGTALILTAGTGGTTETPYTVIYIDKDRDGEVDENTDTIWAPNNGDTTTAGNDLSSYQIYGGSNTGTVSSTKITMLGGLVGSSIYGGSNTSDPTKDVAVSGDTHITISGGTVRSRVSGGGYGRNSTVTGDTHVTISGNASVGGIKGGDAWKGTVNGNTYVTISGNARVEGGVGGGGENGTVGGNTNVTITGGTLTNFVCGGGWNGTVTGNATVTISGGTVEGSIYGGDAYGGTVTGTASVIYPADKLGGAAGTTYTVVDDPVIDNTLGITCGTVTLAEGQSVTLNGKNYTAAEDNTKLNISNGVVSILAGSVVSDEGGNEDDVVTYPVWVGGVKMEVGDYLANDADEVTDEAPDTGGYAHLEMKNGVLVLTLNNYSCNGEDFALEYVIDETTGDTVQTDYAQIASEYPLKLVLEGENTIGDEEHVEEGASCFSHDGIVTLEELTIEGSGSLTIYACDDGIDLLDGNLNIKGGNLNIVSDDDGINAENDIIVDGGYLEIEAGSDGLDTDGDITITKSTLKITADADGLDAEGDITIKESDLNIDVDDDGIYAEGNIKITATDAYISHDGCAINSREGTLTLENIELEGSDDDENWYDLEYDSESTYINECQYIRLKDTYCVYLAGVEMNVGDYLANGADEVTDEEPDGGYAYLDEQNGELVLFLHYYDNEDAVNNIYDGNVLFVNNNLTISVTGENTFTNPDDNAADGISLDGKNTLTITGSGSLYIEADYPIYDYNDEDGCELVITDTTVDIISNEGYGIEMDGDVTVTGSTLGISAPDTESGIEAYGNVDINHSVLTIFNCCTGIDAYGNVDINGSNLSIEAANTGIHSGGSYVYITNTDAFIHHGGYGVVATGDYNEIILDNILLEGSDDNENWTEFKDSGSSCIDDYPYIRMTALSSDVYVGGVKMEDGYYLAVGATEITYEKPAEGGYAHLSEVGNEMVLTLNNYSYSGNGFAVERVIDEATGEKAVMDYAQIYSNRAVKLVLKGENTLGNKEHVTAECSDHDGIVMFADLTIDGEGSLTIYACDDGIDMYDGNLNIKDGNISIVSDDDGFCVDEGDLTITGGNVNINVMDDGIDIDNDIIIKDGILIIVSTDEGIEQNGTTSIKDGKVDITADQNAIEAPSFNMTGGYLLVRSLGEEDYYYPVIDTENFNCDEDLNIVASYESDGSDASDFDIEELEYYRYLQIGEMPAFVFVNGVDMRPGEYLASGDNEVTDEEPSSGGYAYLEEQDGKFILTLDNYSCGMDGMKLEARYPSGIIATKVPLELVLVGENTLGDSEHVEDQKELAEAEEDCCYDHDGIVAYGNLTVSGEGSLAIYACDDGFDLVEGSFIMDGGSINITANGDGFCVDENDVEINDGSVTINARDDGFYLENGAMDINDGTIDITAGDDGIQISGEADDYTDEVISGYYPLTVNGGTLLIVAKDTGISCEGYGDVIINGGSIDITSGDPDSSYGSAGMYVENFTMTGGYLISRTLNNGDEYYYDYAAIYTEGEFNVDDSLPAVASLDYSGSPEETFDSSNLWDYNYIKIGFPIVNGVTIIGTNDISVDDGVATVTIEEDSSVQVGDIIYTTDADTTAVVTIDADGNVTLSEVTGTSITVKSTADDSVITLGFDAEVSDDIIEEGNNITFKNNTEIEISVTTAEEVSTYTVTAVNGKITVNEDGTADVTRNVVYNGGGGGGSVTTSYTVKFETDGADEIKDVKVTKNKTIAEPTEPTKDGYTFVGWFTDEELTKAYDFETKVTKSFTLYAKWEKADEDITGDGECDGTKAGNCPAADFTDVDTTAWYHLNIDYVLENGLMKGTQADKFEPNANLTRAMLVTILYRAEGEPEMKDAQWFEDVAKGQWYSDAVAWATFNGITTGYGNGNFGPDDYITREQIAAIMHRYAKYKGYDVSVGENTNILSYSDFASISEWAIADMQYAVGAGLIKGKTESTLNPSDNATRAEAAAILERFIKAN